MAVHRQLGPGYRENTYQRDLEIALHKDGLSYEPQKLLSVYGSAEKDALIGYYIPDFLVAEQVIVEIKALSWLDGRHLAQVIGYLAVSGCSVGLLINFGRRSLEWKRIFPTQDIIEHRVNHQWLSVPTHLKRP